MFSYESHFLKTRELTQIQRDQRVFLPILEGMRNSKSHTYVKGNELFAWFNVRDQELSSKPHNEEENVFSHTLEKRETR